MENVEAGAVAPLVFKRNHLAALQLLQACRTECSITQLANLGYVDDLPGALQYAATHHLIRVWPVSVREERGILTIHGRRSLDFLERLLEPNLLPRRGADASNEARRWLHVLAAEGPVAIFHLAETVGETETEAVAVLYWLTRSDLVATVGYHEDRTAMVTSRGRRWLELYGAAS